ncbi:MAG: helix-turn-helix transcriptional regulator [Fastidiosipila sp.]|nr:helix-turn-helix transcriptional regulator [Fastidiosipila sp.]
MNLDEILKAIRQELGLSQEAMAHELHMSFATLNRWENKRNLPSRLAMVTLKEFCIQQGVSENIIEELNNIRFPMKGTSL